MQPAAPTAVFDFDHTLTRWDSAARFFVWLLARSPIRLLVGVPLVALLGPLAAFRCTRKIPTRCAVWLATFGRSHEQLHALAIEHIAQVRRRGGAFVHAQARAQIALHQSQGHTVVVATGALENLAREILAAEGIADVTVVGSSLRRFMGGMVADRHCFGEQKLCMLQERGLTPPWSFAYSDHESDLPLLRAATTQFLVNPTAKATAYLMPILGRSATILTWR